MDQESKLAVVVNTTNAESKIRAFNRDLQQMEALGVSAALSVSKIGNKNGLSRIDSGSKTAQDSLKSLTTNIVATTSAIDRMERSASRLRAVMASMAGNIGPVNAGSNALSASAKAEAAAAKLAAANARAASAISNAAAAQARAAAANSNAASAASRAAAAVSNEAAARDRATAAASRAAAAAANAAAAQDRATTASVKLAAAQARAAAQADRLSGSLGRTNTEARGLSGTLSSLQSAVMGSVGALAGFGIIKVADQMQNLNTQIKLVTQSEEEYLLVREKVREIANKNFNNIAATTGLYQNTARALANLGKSQKDAVAFTNAVSLAMATGGRAASEQASAILQLGQAMGSGILQGDEFRSISENAPILLELVSKRLGVLPGQLKELASEGKITAEIMFDALTQNVGILEDMAKKMTLTVSSAYVVASNNFKAYTDKLLNQTGGVTSSIASMIIGVSGNIELLSKVAVAGMGLAFLGVATSIGTATKAMALFNLVVNANPFVLVAGGFLAITSAIYGTEEVLTTSGILLGDFVSLLGTIASDTKTLFGEISGSAEVATTDIGRFVESTRNFWYQLQLDVAEYTGRTEIVIANHNAKNTRSYFGFFKETEEGFAGLVQRILGNITSVGALSATTIETLANWIDNLALSMENMGRASYNAGQYLRDLIGLESSRVEYMSLKDVNPISIYKRINTENQNVVQKYAKGLNTGVYGAAPIIGADGKLVMGFADLKAGANSVLKTGGAPSIYAPKSAELSTAPMSAEKAMQKLLLDQQLAAEARLEAEEKARKEREKAERKANGGKKPIDSSAYLEYANGGSKRNLKLDQDLVKRLSFLAEAGIVLKVTSGGQGAGSRGIVGSTAHNGGRAADGDLYKDGRKLDWNNKGDLPILKAVVEEAASRGINGIGAGNDYMGAGRFHFGIQKTSAAWGKDGKGANALPWVKEAHSKGLARKQDDSFIGKYQDRENKALELLMKKQEEMRQLQIKLIGEYGTKEEQLALEHDKRMIEISESGFNDTKKKELEEESKARMESELAVYRDGFNRQLSDLSAFQQTKQYMIEQARKNEIFDAENNKELRRSENAEILKEVKNRINAKYDYEQQQNTARIQRETKELYAFQRTERETVKDAWDFKIAEAESSYDEMAMARLIAYKIQSKQELDIFDVNQDLKMLELKKMHMTEIEYINQKYALDKRLLDLSNVSPEERLAQSKNLDSSAFQAAGEVKKRVGNDYDALMRDLYGQSDSSSNLDSAWEAQREVLKSAYEEGVILKDEYYANLEDLDKRYQDRQQAIVTGGYETAFGAAASLLKAFGAEKLGIYRAMFVTEKAFALKRVLLENQVALSKAWSSAAFPYNLPAFGASLLQTGAFTSALDLINPAGFKSGGYTGNYGVNQAVGPVHGQEYVFDAPATKRIGVDNLDAMRRGQSIGGGDQINFNINVTVDAKGNSNITGDSDKMGKRMAQAIKAAVLDVIYQEKRQGGALYGS